MKIYEKFHATYDGATWEELQNKFQVWADIWGGYLGRAPFADVDEARAWILAPSQRGYRQYHRMRIFNQMGQEIEVIEAECND
jgi:hypothetical protein